MKVATRVVALLAVLASATAANADTHVWFTAVATSGANAEVVTDGAPGVGTVLKCNKDLAPCTWAITMAFANDAGDAPVITWSSALVSGPSIGKVSVDQGSLAYAANNFTTHAITATYGPLPAIIRNMNGQDFGAGSGGGNLGTFTLRKAGIGLNTEHVFLFSDDSEWANANGEYPNMQAGGNGSVAGGGGAGFDLGEVITIINFPEPSSLSLLGLGALALIRRRR